MLCFYCLHDKTFSRRVSGKKVRRALDWALGSDSAPARTLRISFRLSRLDMSFLQQQRAQKGKGVKGKGKGAQNESKTRAVPVLNHAMNWSILMCRGLKRKDETKPL